MRVAIIGTELSNLICAHTLLDQHPEIELHLIEERPETCLLYTSPSPRDRTRSRMPSSA